MTSAGPATTGVPVAATALPQQVKQTRDRLFALLREVDPDAADWADRVRRSRPLVPSVVVVGETNRGKSSLVNALVDAPGLSPVDASVATSTYLEFRHGERWRGLACYPADAEPVEFAVAELPAWASARTTPPEGALPPRHLRIEAPLDVLAALTVVDTPGVGGLDSVHGELAAEAASAATALLFVADASAPFTRGELDFLHGAADRVETVVFALAKTDQHRGWRRVLEENRALLAEHAPRFADVPIHPVSARLWELAAQAPNEQAATMLRERSGVAELRSALEQLVGGRAAMLGEANTMRALSTVLGELAVRLAAEQRALTVGEDEAESLRARRDELSASRRSSTRGWQLKLRGEIQRTRVEVSHEVTRQMREVQSWFRRAIDTAEHGALTALPHQVDTALQMVSSRVSALLSARLAKVAEVSLAELFSAEELDVIRSQFARGAQSPIALRPPDKRAPTAEDKLLVFMGISGGLGVGRAAAMPLAGIGVGVLNPVVLPVTIVLGLGAGWWMARTRKHAADKQHLKQWLTEAIADARSALDQLVSEQLIEAEQQLSLALDDALGRRIESIEAELREVDKALKMDAAERSRRLHTAEQRLAEARSGRDRAEHLLGAIRGLRDRAE
ncbi:MULTISPECIES: dynamin family protein [unclassified Saccharopolyspora]|uniref:dynamin family protein n=1 Tax=unclassified Saccharopolyspora TaxID=2646250 RepID=UPI001CD1F4EB|nr:MULTISPECIES: dynamin family protein [unclassified Saccharopolyspora]MCA1188408.1 dynamin family protein [Saccharopolyspora sp. 6T]MCA1194818.1 dynamin family protein [Saccharopolyspora sp. 6V]MCA1228975.1 dynamin family protein [Saccharopolyspora sp. 6M]MCA1281280.1 dynamin family protein [Saccharopolyspora sp. 7B]